MVANPIRRRSADVEAGPGGTRGPAGVPGDCRRTIPGEAISRCLPWRRPAAGGDAVVLSSGGVFAGAPRPAIRAADRQGVSRCRPHGQRDTVESTWIVGGRLDAAP